jgi:hypothetical protein
VCIEKVAHVVMLLMLIGVWSASEASAVSLVSIQPASLVVPLGQSFTLDIDIADVTELFSFQFDLMFHPGVLAAASITEGAFLPSGGSTVFLAGTIDNTSGTISVTAGSLIGFLPGVQGSGTLATVNFQALALGTSPIALANVILLDTSLADITPNISDGAVTVQSVAALVPEPATWLLFATGLLGLFGYAGRKM